MSEWVDTTLGEVLTLQRGFDITKKEQRSGSVPVVSSSGIASFHDESKVGDPGVVVGRKGSLGTVFFLNRPFWPHDTTLWVKDFRGNDPYFCYLLLQSLHLADLDAGSSNPTLNRNHAHKVRVRRPSLGIQRRIAAVIRTFDELIEINARRIELLGDLARSLYREWFVHFRFPGRESMKLVDSELGSIPQGWSVGRLEEFAEVSTEGVDPSSFEPENPYVGLEHLPRRRTTLQEWGSIDSVKSRKLRFLAEDTIFGKIRPYFHKVVWAPFDGLASSDAIIFRARPNLGFKAFVNAVASSDGLVAEAVATSNGTKMPRADYKALLRYEIAVPNDLGLISTYESIARPWLAWCADQATLNRQLAATRDLLLPRLVTGKLDISDIDLGVLTPAETE